MLNLNKNDHGLLLNVNDYIYNIYHKPLADFNKCKSVENKKFKKKNSQKEIHLYLFKLFGQKKNKRKHLNWEGSTLKNNQEIK